MVSVNTGQVLDYGFASNICLQYFRKKEKCREKSNELQTWYASHRSTCTKNHSGASGAMERILLREHGTIPFSTIYVTNISFAMETARSTTVCGMCMVSVMTAVNGRQWTRRAMLTRNGLALMITKKGNLTMNL